MAERLLHEIIMKVEGEAVLLDRTEVLFSRDLALDPFRLLSNLGRYKTVNFVAESEPRHFLCLEWGTDNPMECGQQFTRGSQRGSDMGITPLDSPDSQVYADQPQAG